MGALVVEPSSTVEIIAVTVEGFVREGTRIGQVGNVMILRHGTIR